MHHCLAYCLWAMLFLTGLIMVKVLSLHKVYSAESPKPQAQCGKDSLCH